MKHARYIEGKHFTLLLHNAFPVNALSVDHIIENDERGVSSQYFQSLNEEWETCPKIANTQEIKISVETSASLPFSYQPLCSFSSQFLVAALPLFFAAFPRFLAASTQDLWILTPFVLQQQYLFFTLVFSRGILSQLCFSLCPFFFSLHYNRQNKTSLDFLLQYK